MMDLAQSKLFTPWSDPESGVTFYVLITGIGLIFRLTRVG